MNQDARKSTPAWAEHWVRLLDDGLRVPGTSLRFGLDAVLGLLFPGGGDVIAALCGLSLIWLALKQQAPRPVIARMLLNLALDALVGAIPVLGDLFDLTFKANRRNLELLQAHTRSSDSPTESDTPGRGWLVLAVVVMLGALAVPITVALLLARWIWE